MSCSTALRDRKGTINTSGGHYDYFQYQLEEKAREAKKDAWYALDAGDKDYGNLILSLVDLLSITAVLMKRIDWVESGDDSIDTLKEELVEQLTTECRLYTPMGRRLRKSICRAVAAIEDK
jgi:hypothetical protein